MSESLPPLWRPDPSDVDDAKRSHDQKVFDTVTGPNLRLRDNMIQLAAIVAGTAVGTSAGSIYARSTGSDPAGGAVLGGFAGLLFSLLFSGFVIGLVRTVLAANPSPRERDDSD